MATQKITPFPSPKQVPETIHTPPQEVSQAQLAAILQLRREARKIQDDLAQVEAEVKSALEVGADVEPGTYVARLDERFRASIPWKEKAIDLATRLGLNGPAWAQNVLSHTKKTRTVSLFVA